MRFNLKFFILVIIILFNPFNIKANTLNPENEKYKINLSKSVLYQGDPLIISIELPGDIKLTNLFLGDKKLYFYEIEKNHWLSFYGISTDHKIGKSEIKVELSNQQAINKTITIKKRIFPITKIETNKELEKKDFTLDKIEQKIKEDNKLIEKTISEKSNQIYFSQEFSYPLKKIKVVGDFGNIRKNQNSQFQHLGVDLESKVKTPVYSINDGIVKFAKDLETYGKTIIIDHGPGIKSIYLHLDKIFVKENEIVKNKQIIGLSGNTGYSLEPHLHLSIKIFQDSVDPLNFIKESNNFFKKIGLFQLNKIFAKEFTATIFKSINWGFEEKKDKRYIDTIIIHSSYNPLDNESYNLEKIINIYKYYNVAPHYIIDKNGDIYKLVDENNIAYHAGESTMPDGRKKVNNFSIGIEIIYKKDESPNENQYQALANLIKNIKSRYNIKYILGHNQIAPLRKDDPWNFNWEKLNNLINQQE
jgi:murein DD-endopeptidase MepM/ murein hydrolase activator NlpD